MKLRDKLLIPIGLALLGVLVVNLGAMQIAVSAWEGVAAHRVQAHEQVRLLLEAEVAFKRQVQEWKNILIRGQDEAEFVAYVAAFRVEEQRVQEQLRAFAQRADRPEDRASADQLAARHRDLGVRYREALDLYQTAPDRPMQVADDAVRGVDRPLTDDLATLRRDTESYLTGLAEASASRGHWTAWGMVGASLGMTALIAGMLLTVITQLVVRPAQAASVLSARLLDPAGFDEEPTDLADAASDDELGQLLGALGTLRDAVQHERRQTRDALHALERARENAETANEAKAAFLAAVSHELRTPLNGVVGSLQLLEDGQLDGEQRLLVAAAASSSRRLATLVEDILDYTQVSGGDVELEQRPFDVEEVMRDLLDEFRESVLARGVALELVAAPGGPRMLMGDRARLRRVVGELVKNAVDVTAMGEIDVVLATAETPTGARVQIDVVDTGPGVPESMREQIFEPFTQVHGGLSRSKEGAGLGLSMCRQLVAHLGGTLDYEPNQHGGSRFTLEIPFQLAGGMLPELLPSDADADEDDDVLEPVPGARVLVVGRSEAWLVGALRQLAVPAIHVVTLEDAMLHLAEHPFELAFVDVSRVGVGSVDDLRDIVDSVGHLTALVACARPETRDRCLADGWDEVIADHSTPGQVSTLLARWMTTPLSQAS